ncbi:MAG: substrate-binding domain-containing protein [Gammaproteobacteria bacterium]|nr:substrate-binding domain-containing protein [Gammaproteobacteria bacterium]MBU1440745.1 substrate-binding domain-containing protein [Gammaproteobacteria bacterium]MBU2408443.1 substrate-binding domain-containing protein [Gammaproteobacteria bacterium]
MNLIVFSGGAAQAVVTGLQPAFEKAEACTLAGTFGAVGTMRDKLLAGEACDVLVLSESLIKQLTEQGHVVVGSARALGHVATGVAVPDGAPSIRVDSSEALRDSLASSTALFVPDLRKSTAGIHIAGVLKKLGLDDELAERIREFPNGATAMREMAQSGIAGAIGATQVTEIMGTPGIRLIAELPAEHALSTVYVAAVCSASEHPEQARRLVDRLSNEASADLRRRSGFAL